MQVKKCLVAFVPFPSTFPRIQLGASLLVLVLVPVPVPVPVPPCACLCLSGLLIWG